MTTTGAYQETTINIPSATEGWNIEAWQFLPENTTAPTEKALKKPPVIVMRGTWIRSHESDELTRAFAARGYAVIVFDYRRWGGSDGQPRTMLIVKEQLQDYRTVIAFARANPELFDGSRVVLFGTSFSGGHITQLASEDPALATAIGQCPFQDGLASAFALSIQPTIKMIPFAIFDTMKKILPGYKPLYVPNTAKKGGFGMLAEEGTHEGLTGVAKVPTDYPNRIQASALWQIPFYRPCASSKKISCPFFLSIPTSDNLCPPKGALTSVKNAKKGESIRVEGGHFDCYPGFKSHEKGLNAMLEFLERNVPV